MLLDRIFTPGQVQREQAVLRTTLGDRITDVLMAAAVFITRTLIAGDPQLGRPGAVCPFAAAAERASMISLRVLPIRSPDTDALTRAALELRQAFPTGDNATLSPEERLQAGIILLPFLDARESGPLLEAVQRALKPSMVPDGLMIGEFYPGCPLPGLNNPFFRPSNTEFSCLAVRRMTAGDLPFLLDDEHFLAGYLARFGEDGRRRLDKVRAGAAMMPAPWTLAPRVAPITAPIA